MVNMTTPGVYLNDSESDYGRYWNTSRQSVSPGWYYRYDWAEIQKSVRIMSMVIYSVVCVLGVLGNGVVIWATGFRMKKTVSTVWYLNLAVADFLLTASLKVTEVALDYQWPFGWFLCKMDRLVFYMNMFASIYTLVVISVDRCVGVVCPVWARCSGHRTVRKASWVSLGVWVMALAPSLPHVTPEVGLEGSGCIKLPDSNLFLSNFILGFVFPFSIIISCYSVIIYWLRNKRPLASQSGRSFKIIAAVITAFFLCWIPLHIMVIYHVRYYEDPLTKFNPTLELKRSFGIPITLTLALANSCLNPLLYVFSQGFTGVFRSRSIVKVLEKAFAEEPLQNNSTPADPNLNRLDIALSGMEGSTAPPGTKDPEIRTPNQEPPESQDLPGDCPV